jgi:hypothetical protein
VEARTIGAPLRYPTLDPGRTPGFVNFFPDIPTLNLPGDAEREILLEKPGPPALDPATAEQVRERALTALAQEVGLMLKEGVVAAPMDIDLCLILGAGWPFHLGGITPYLDRAGVSERVLGQRFLPPGIASVA